MVHTDDNEESTHDMTYESIWRSYNEKTNVLDPCCRFHSINIK